MIAQRSCEIIGGRQACLLSMLLMGRAAIGPICYLRRGRRLARVKRRGSGRRRNRRGSVRAETTQKGNLFKGLQKRRTIPPNRHGKTQTRKGKKVLKPSKISKEMEADRELSKFINHCNEIKAATAASKEGGQLSILKPETNASTSSKTQEKKLENSCQY